MTQGFTKKTKCGIKVLSVLFFLVSIKTSAATVDTKSIKCANDDKNITYHFSSAGEAWIVNGKTIDPRAAKFLDSSKLVKSVQHQGSIILETYSIRFRISIMSAHEGRIIMDYMTCVYSH